jgi:ankyrin repeat protein
MTALMWSAQQNHHHIVDLLLKHGANLQAQCSDGSSVLHQAAYAGSTKAVQKLITYGADKHLSLKRFLDATNKDGSTPLLLACYAGHVEVVTCLLQHGASVHATNQAGWTPLHGAASGGHLEVARMLLEHGANLHTKVTQ